MPVAILLGFLVVAAWFTHVIYSIINELWLALIAGAIMFPVGIIHGVLIWFGNGLIQ